MAALLACRCRLFFVHDSFPFRTVFDANRYRYDSRCKRRLYLLRRLVVNGHEVPPFDSLYIITLLFTIGYGGTKRRLEFRRQLNVSWSGTDTSAGVI